jgi:hypothetical protein
MRALTLNQMQEISGGDYFDKACGLAIGAVIVGSIVGSWVGFALTMSKAVPICTGAALT